MIGALNSLNVLRSWAVVVAQVEEHRKTDLEGPSSIPGGSWAFFLFSPSYQWRVHNQVPRGGATLLIFLSKMLRCAA